MKKTMILAGLAVSMLAIAGCKKKQEAPPADAPAATTEAPTSTTTPPPPPPPPPGDRGSMDTPGDPTQRTAGDQGAAAAMSTDNNVNK